jgi:hypothetical protein
MISRSPSVFGLVSVFVAIEDEKNVVLTYGHVIIKRAIY